MLIEEQSEPFEILSPDIESLTADHDLADVFGATPAAGWMRTIADASSVGDGPLERTTVASVRVAAGSTGREPPRCPNPRPSSGRAAIPGQVVAATRRPTRGTAMRLQKIVRTGLCADCGERAVTTLEALEYCRSCSDGYLADIEGAISARAEGVGQGAQTGTLRPDFGPDHADLGCTICDAGWVGIPGDPCGWCRARNLRRHDEQRQILLWPELPDGDNRERARVMRGWLERLIRGVEIDLITSVEADRSWRKNQR
jgi:hypothetical protein